MRLEENDLKAALDTALLHSVERERRFYTVSWRRTGQAFQPRLTRDLQSGDQTWPHFVNFRGVTLSVMI